MRKWLMFLLFGLFVLSIFAQENDASFDQKTLKNSISVGINTTSYLPVSLVPYYIGYLLEYERLLGNKFSIAFETSVNMLLFPYCEINGRFFPWSGMFFTSFGLGFGRWVWTRLQNITPTISTEFGWKIDFGKRKKWFLMPSIAGKAMFFTFYEDKKIVLDSINPEINLRIGYKF